MLTVEKRWGREEILYHGQYLLKQLTLNPASQTSMHFHYVKTETLFILDGSLMIQFDDANLEDVELEAGDHYTIAEGKINAHRMINDDPNKRCVYLEASTPHLYDSERIRL